MKYILSFIAIAILVSNPVYAIFHEPCSSLNFDSNYAEVPSLVSTSSSCRSETLKELYLNRAQYLMQMDELLFLAQIELQVLGHTSVANYQLTAHETFMSMVEAMSQSLNTNNEATASYLNQIYIENKVGVEAFVNAYSQGKYSSF